jgi:phenylacetate-coenzyme A ligase PaaK-like adenylate-forming protein
MTEEKGVRSMIMAERFNYPAQYLEQSRSALEAALGTAPIYRRWRALDPGPNASLDARYDALPELTKHDMREHFPLGLVAGHLNVEEALARNEIEYTFTSGTTSEKVVNLWNQGWWDGAEAASWKLNARTASLGYPQKEAKLASSLNVGIHCEEDLPMENRTLGRTLYLNEKLSILSWQPRHMARMARELKAYRPVILEANPSLLARLAFWAMDEGIELYSPAVIVFTYELPSKIHLTAIRKVFGSPFVSSYGTTETGFVMTQCEAGMFHQNMEYCRIDFHPLKGNYGGPELGRILVTTFKNPWSAILRFDTGDLIRLHPTGRCACGRDEGFVAKAIEGRASNATFTTRGDLVTPMALDDLLAQAPEIRDYRFIQHNPKKYELQAMLTDGLPRVQNRVREALTSLYGEDGSYAVSPVPNILPGPSGKFRRTQANFDFDLKGLFA